MDRNFIRTVLFVGFLSLFLVACGGGRYGDLTAQQYNQKPFTVAIPAGTDNSVVIDAAEAAFLGREWSITSQSDNEIVGNLVHRYYDATVTIKIEGNHAVLYSDAKYDGPQVDNPVPGVPVGWLKNLKADMDAKLGNPG